MSEPNTPAPTTTPVSAPPLDGNDALVAAVMNQVKPPPPPHPEPRGDDTTPTPPKQEPVPASPDAAATPKPEDAKAQSYTPKKAMDWDILKSKVSKAEAEAAKLREELENAKKSPQAPADYEKIIKERDEYRQRIRQFDIERDPEFQRQYDGRIKQQVEKIQRLVGPDNEKIAAKLLSNLSHENLGEVADALSDGLTPGRSTLLGAALNDLLDVQSERQSKVAESIANWETYQRTRSQEPVQKASSLIQEGESALNETLQRLSTGENALTLFQQAEGDEKWNTSLAESVAHARNALIGKTDPKGIAELLLWGARVPTLLEHLSGQMSEVERLTAELEGLKKASPGVKGVDAQDGGGKAQYDGLSYGDAIAKIAADTGAFRR